MRSRIVSIVLSAAAALPAAAQDSPLIEARAALARCIEHAESELTAKTDAAKTSYENAKRLFEVAVRAQPKSADAHAGLGEAISRCGIPLAGMVSIMGVVDASSRSLERALELDATHWQARFVLAMNSYHMPEFLNRMPEAIRHLETLRSQQGARNDQPYFALTYRYLGDAYTKVGRRADAQMAYAAGAKLFPNDAVLQQRAGEANVPDQGAPAAQAAEPGAGVVALAPLRVEAAAHQLEDARGGTALNRLDIMTMPGGTGEMLQTLQSLPGTTRAGDGADLYVRGGDPEETPVFVNGGRLVFPGRWESLGGATMGVLDASVLSRAYFSAGGFSAKFGNALSGVVDVESHGRPLEPRARVGANLVSAGGSVFRPLGERAGAWGAVLLTDVSLVARMQGETDTYPDMPRSYQLVGGGSLELAPRAELKAVALAVGDRSSRIIDAGGYSGPFESRGSTQHTALNARWVRGDGRAGISGGVTASLRSGGYDFGVLARDRDDRAFGARLDGDVVSGSGARLRAGVELTRYEAVTDGAVPLTAQLQPGSPVRRLHREAATATHAGAYVETERQIAPSLLAVAGVRADRLPGAETVTLDPRAALAYTAGDWTLRTAAGVFHQGSWRRTYRLPQSGAPAGVPTRARHLIAGIERGGEPAVRVEAFLKQYDRYTAEDGALDVSGATTRGVDAMLRWQRQARLNGWITYSLLDATLDLVDGASAPAKYDVTHTFTGVARFALTDNWELGSTVRFATGKPWTPVIGTTPSSQEGWPAEPVFAAAHSDRLPDYFRIDGRLMRYQRIGESTAVLYLEALDLNGRRNIMSWQYDATYTRKKPVESFFARRTFVFGAELQL